MGESVQMGLASPSSFSTWFVEATVRRRWHLLQTERLDCQTGLSLTPPLLLYPSCSAAHTTLQPVELSSLSTVS